jgi:hypothetical protein
MEYPKETLMCCKQKEKNNSGDLNNDIYYQF